MSTAPANAGESSGSDAAFERMSSHAFPSTSVEAANAAIRQQNEHVLQLTCELRAAGTNDAAARTLQTRVDELEAELAGATAQEQPYEDDMDVFGFSTFGLDNEQVPPDTHVSCPSQPSLDVDTSSQHHPQQQPQQPQDLSQRDLRQLFPDYG